MKSLLLLIGLFILSIKTYGQEKAYYLDTLIIDFIPKRIKIKENATKAPILHSEGTRTQTPIID